MAKLVLALGAVMSLIGIAAVVTGYPIIQVERGWASVIAGSTLLAGGVITVSLGLAIRALARLEKGLRQRTSAAPNAPGEPYADGHALPDPASPLVVAGPDVAAEEPVAAWVPEPSRFELAPAPEPETAPKAEPEPEKAPRTIEEQTEALLMRNAADAAIEAKSKPAKPAPAFEAPEEEPPAPPPRMPRVAAPFGVPTRAREPDVQKEPDTAIDPAKIDDWFDGEFSDLDRHAPEPPAAAPADLAPPTRPEPEPALAEAPPTVAEAAPPPTSAVIGRYESEGTSYVMYADGSIEAQSPAGVYRFGSMAELKAFIEG